MNSPISTLPLSELTQLNTEANFYSFLRKDTPHQISWFGARLMYEKIALVLKYEQEIDPNKQLYMFTWSPDPKKSPNCDFDLQHEYNIDLVSSFLKMCEIGLACVESCQEGFPHYHGWYQLSDCPVKEKARIAMIKTMQQFGKLRINKSRGYYKIGSWSPYANCLYYYKKDLLQNQLLTAHNPIYATTYPKKDIHWNHFFRTEGKRETIADIEDKVSLREFYKGFYTNSI